MGTLTRRVVAATFVVSVAAAPTVASAQQPGDRDERTFALTNLGDGQVHDVVGTEARAACAADTVVLLQHGLSYTGASWDVPGYSYVQRLVDAGYDVVAVDRLGYGRSVLDDGYAVSTMAYADMTAQMVDELRDEYDHVVIGGHSAGGETVVQAAGLFGAAADAVISMGYHTYPDPLFLGLDWVPGDQARALQDDYEYFLGTPERRAEMFYTEHADPDVIAADTASAVLTPSGEILTISLQPARVGSVNVTVPVLAQLADSDRLFPVDYADLWAAQFVQSPSVTVDVVPDSGHTYMLHHAGPAAADRIVEWLGGTAGLPGCEVVVAAEPDPAPADEPPAPAPAPAPASEPVTDALPATGGGLVPLAAATLLTALASRASSRDEASGLVSCVGAGRLAASRASSRDDRRVW